MTEELKTCPFCGGTDIMSFDTGAHWVSCQTCGAEGPVVDDREDAVAKWNERQTVVVAQRSQTCPKCFRTDAEFKDTTEKRGIIPCGDPWHADDHLRRKIAVPAERGDGNRAIPFDRNALGRMVREAWVRWALTQPNPKPSWLAPYDDLDERDKEADRQIGEAIARWTLIGDAASSQSPAASADRQTLSEQERHAVEHARFQADRATPGDPECCFDFELVKTLVQIVDRRSPAVTDAMCEAALDADAPDRIQGFSYSKRHVIRDVWANKEIWCAPVGSPEDHQAFQRQCQIERMRRALEAALGCPSQPVSDDEPDTNDGEDYLNARRGHPGTVKNLSEPRG
jgi:Lar family restriction alleviation protein